MKMNKRITHTPGPWQLIDNESYCAITDDIQDEGICEVHGTYKLEHMKANARLIASAPELLGALIAARAKIVEMSNQLGRDPNGQVDSLVRPDDTLDSLIERATGCAE